MTCFYGVLGGGIVSLGLMKWQMKKQAQESNIKILYDYQGPIDIGSGLTSLFPNVQLIYNEEKIKYKIQYITGTIKNTDKKRTVKTLDEPFVLILPENCEVLEAKILETPKEEIKSENKGNKVEISTPKTILPQEQIKYCILYKSPNKVDSGITLETRIADVDVIPKDAEAEDVNVKFYFRSFMFLFIRVLVFVTLSLLIAVIPLRLILFIRNPITIPTNIFIFCIVLYFALISFFFYIFFIRKE